PRTRLLPLGRRDRPALRPGGRRLTKPQPAGVGRPPRPPEDPRTIYAIPTRDPSARQLTTGHCPAVPTRASQSDSRRCRHDGRPTPAPTTPTMTKHQNLHTTLDNSVHLR